MWLRKINGRIDLMKMEWQKIEKESNGTVFSNQPTSGQRSLVGRNCNISNKLVHSANDIQHIAVCVQCSS
jgi:hypothetical protein